MSRTVRRDVSLTTLALLLMVACGGGSDDPTPAQQQPPPQELPPLQPPATPPPQTLPPAGQAPPVGSPPPPPSSPPAPSMQQPPALSSEVGSTSSALVSLGVSSAHCDPAQAAGWVYAVNVYSAREGQFVYWLPQIFYYDQNGTALGSVFGRWRWQRFSIYANNQSWYTWGTNTVDSVQTTGAIAGGWLYFRSWYQDADTGAWQQQDYGFCRT